MQLWVTPEEEQAIRQHLALLRPVPRDAPIEIEPSRRPADRRSRHQRWQDAVQELMALREEYRMWADSIPTNLEWSATGERLKAIYDLDLESLEVELPRGFGRDY
ncbi:MAG: hypothetical protein ACREXW_11390 [Gammaproteobacteria bacterium]